MTSDSQHESPIIRDKRRIDPATGELRETLEESVPDGEAPVSPSGEAGPGEGEADAAAAGGDGEAGGEALAAAQAEVLDLADQLARAKAEVYNTEQRFNAFVKRSREQEAAARETGRADVVEALIPVLDDVELARQHGELEGPFLAIADKLEQTLAARYGVERYGAVGEEFDPTFHEALMHTTDEEAELATIAMVAQPGYRRGETVIRPARVGVVGPA